MITTTELLERGLLHPSISDEKSATYLERLDMELAGETTTAVSERHATDFLCYTDGELEQTIIAALCERAGLKYSSSHRVIPGSQLNQDLGVSERRSIDFVVVDAVDANGEYLGPSPDRAVLIAVEAKFNAMVNGGWGYCAVHEGYSNQVICYTLGCINEALDTEAGTRFIWLGLDTGRHEQPWGNKAINGHDGVEFDAARKLQDQAATKWTSMDWAEIYDVVEAHFAAEPDLASAILRAIGADDKRRRTRPSV